jgi:tetratricopeptide (TPR) repeat protein
MSAAFQRGMVLFGQGRYDLADREFRRGLAEDPGNAFAHAVLALCLAERQQNDEALREVDEAVGLGPELPFCHFARGRILLDQKRVKDAEAAAREAIRLDPDDADHYGLLSQIHILRRRWAEALEAAERGLSLDAEHAACTNLRAMALVNLGRKDEAAQTLHSALANDPENSLTHANQGWALLHQGDHAKALGHFQEALRIDPQNEWARVGIIEALKSRYLIYRVMLRFSLWLARKSRAAQWAFILGLLLGQNILFAISRAHPKLATLLQPLLWLVCGFLLLTWTASPLFNLLLRLNKFGRLALSREQRVESNWIGSFFVIAAGALVVNLFAVTNLSFIAMLFCGLMLLPLAVTFAQPAGRPRKLMAAVTACVALLAIPLLSIVILGGAGPFGNVDQAIRYFRYFVSGAILSTWVPALLSLRSVGE